MLSLANSEENEIEFNGIFYNVDTSFNNIIKVINFCKEKIDNDEFFYRVFFELMLDEVPDLGRLDENNKNYSDLVNGLLNNFIFLTKVDDVVEHDLSGNPLPQKYISKNKSDYDLDFDADLIYSAFMQTYGIDLIDQQGKLSWSRFNALLNSLPDNTRFVQVREIRTKELPKGKGTAKERRELLKAKKKFALPGQKIEGKEEENE